MTNSNTLRKNQITVYDNLCRIIHPRNQSDRTSFRRITKWIIKKCEDGTYTEEEISARVFDFAKEANNPKSRNPAAVFTTILKKELGYPN